jgi:hypothetical protein
MAYVGTPIDTINQFQSLVGKRFSGDASTTAFTLDVAPNSVFDIEVFVENVRQDPNSAYTLNGTTLTFSAAPPSGTNNIYVIHQAKAVGTITAPVGGSIDMNGVELILDEDGDTTITADTDDQIDIKIGGADDFAFKANKFEVQTGSNVDMNGTELILDADGDTSITADTDDQIDFRTGGTDRVSIDSSGHINTTASIKPTTAQTTTPLVDSSGLTLSMANDAIASFASTSGVVFVNEQSVSGESAIYVTGGGNIAVGGQSGNNYSAESGGSANFRFYRDGDNYKFQNKSGSTVTVSFIVFKMRSSV